MRFSGSGNEGQLALTRYRLAATVIWEVETDLRPDELIDQERCRIQRCVSEELTNCEIVARLDRLKDRSDLVRLAEFRPEEVLPYVRREATKHSFKVNGSTHRVKMNSQRYFLFRENLTCVSCGLIGEKMAMEQNAGDEHPHFNLYAIDVDGSEVLMTKDHIQPKFHEGVDRHSNYQTMCSICNNIKGSSNVTLEELRVLRGFYNDRRARLGKKGLHEAIEAKRREFERPERSWMFSKDRPRKKRSDFVYANIDLSIRQLKTGQLNAFPAYDPIPPESAYFGCIKQGQVLEPLADMGQFMLIKLDGEEAFLVRKTFVSE